jgi:predicted DNA-binding transcriptional regulator YafY
MNRSSGSRRRPGVHITLARAARLHRLVSILAQSPRRREDLLQPLAMGLRTFYRELELLKRCGVKIRLAKKRYALHSTSQEAEGRLPFPDPQLSFADMAELARHPGPVAKRLAELLHSVIHQPIGPVKPQKARRGKRGKMGKK